MTQEEKQLLLIDLCARLPYGLICNELGQAKKLLSVSPSKAYGITLDNGEYTRGNYKIEDIKPYLRPMSSMTNEEKKDILQSLNIYGDIDNEGNLLLGTECNTITLKTCKKYLGELNKRMFDVCHMIEKGLALEAPKDMYK